MAEIDLNSAQFDEPHPDGGNIIDLDAAQYDKNSHQDGSFVDRVKSDYQNRLSEGQQAVDAYNQGRQSEGLTELDYLGKVGFGTLSDVGGEALKSAASYIPQDIKDAAASGLHYLASTPPGRDTVGAAHYLGSKYQDFAQRYPDYARHIEAAANIGGMLAPEVPIKGTSVASAAVDAATDAAKTVGKAAAEAVPAVAKAGAAGASAVKDSSVIAGISARGSDVLEHAVNDMKDVARASYKKSEDLGAVLTPDAAQSVVSGLDKIIPEAHTAASQKLYKKTAEAISDLKSDVEAGDVSLQTLDRHRQILGNIAKDITNPNRAQEALAAGNAIDAIDQAVNGFGKKHIVNQSTEAIDALNDARAQWSKAKKFEMVSDAISGANGDPNKIKSAFMRLYNNDKKMLGLTEAEKETIRIAGTNTMTEKILKGLGRFGISPENVYLPFVGGATATAMTGGVPAAGLVGAGTVARQTGKYIARGKAEKVLRQIEKR